MCHVPFPCLRVTRICGGGYIHVSCPFPLLARDKDQTGHRSITQDTGASNPQSITQDTGASHPQPYRIACVCDKDQTGNGFRV